MYSATTVWLIAIVALAVGIGVGYAAQRLLRREPTLERGSVEEQLQAQQDQYRHYRYDINAHFSRTAELLGQLANSYREVHNHLARGAQELCDPEAVKALKPLPDDKPVLEERQPSVVEPPRDYALRASPYDKGVLDEDFGLEKSRREPLPEPPRYL